MSTPREKLIERLVKKPEGVLVVVGSGVTVATTNHAQHASWKGLLEHGVCYCLEHLNVTEDWARLRRDQLKQEEFVEVASAISQKLRAPTSGRFAGWLQATVGKLAVSDPRLIKALADWGAALATTNYDTLISQQTGLEAKTWKDHAFLSQFIAGDIRCVLHLHGVHNRPDTVVLDASSYEDIVRDRPIQDAMKALVYNKAPVFVGCGYAGLRDPNLGGLINWYREVLAEAIRPGYLLACESERAEWLNQLSGSQIDVVEYGASYNDLPGFLEQVAEEVNRKRSPVLPFDGLVAAQPGFDQSVKKILAQEVAEGQAETMRKLMEQIRLHCRVGGRRSAWMVADGRLGEQGKALQVEERIRFGIELAEMILTDGMPDRALDTLEDIQADVESGEVSQELRHGFWEVQSRCLQAIGPLIPAERALNQAIATATDDTIRQRLHAELAEIRFLRWEGQTTDGSQEASEA